MGAAVRELLQHLQQQQPQAQQQQQVESEAAGCVGSGREVVLIVTTDFTHAGPWYKELPPAGVTLTDYMAAQDRPVIKVRACCQHTYRVM